MKTVFVDVDTQLDFLSPGGALYVPGAEQIAESLAALTKFAAAQDIAVISTLDSHTEDDIEFKTWKPHCVVGTHGHQKYSGTLLQPPSKNQILLAKHTIDLFADSKLDGVIADLPANRYVVYGLVTEYCVAAAAFGLLDRGKQVELVTDAIRSLSEAEEQRILRELKERGGRLTTAAEVTVRVTV